ncbi:MAG TPA: NUDIX domain-containing protein [archaeon]|nr:NUDIX domain-containing protein [archaeon]
MSAEELFDIVDRRGLKTGTARRSEVHGNPELIHRSVHVLVLDNQSRLYLQKRGPDKDIQPGKWDTSVGGHVGLGEGILEAARREMSEELGIESAETELMYEYIWRSAVETELVASYLCRYDGPVKIDPAEISEGRFWDFAEIESSLGSGIFTPNFEEEFTRLKTFILKSKT